MSNFHRDAISGDIHVIHQFTYANAAARLAAVLSSTDIGKVARQTDNETYWILKDDSPLTWQQLGAGSGSGGINYIENYDIESDASGYTAYADGAAAPVDGGGGSPTLSIARTTSSPLRGAASLLLTPGALGDGASYDFTISRADFARIIKISFDYEIGTYNSYTDGDIGVYIISASDSGFTTNIEVVQCAPYKVLKVSGQETFETVFQSHASNQYYRVCFHQITSATGYTLKMDNILCGPQNIIYGSPIGDWVAYTPTVSGSNTTAIEGYWRRVGDSMELVGRCNFTGANSSTTFSLPSGFSIDPSKVMATTLSNPDYQIVGAATKFQSGVSLIDLQAAISSTTEITFTGTTTSGGSISFANGDGVAFIATVPIAGWSSSVEMSSDASTRVVAFQASTSASTSIGTDVIVPFATVIQDTHASWNGTDTYTVPVSGYYRMSLCLKSNAGSFTANNGALAKVLKNNSFLKTISEWVAGSTSTISFILNGSTTAYFNAGDTIKIQADSTTTVILNGVPERNHLEIERISGPAQIAASETVAARYTSAAGQSIPNGTGAVVDFGTKDYDTHGAVTTGASWRFTAPIQGYYECSAFIKYASASFTGGNEASLYLRKNGTNTSRPSYFIAATGTQQPSVLVRDVLFLNAGDYVDFFSEHGEGSNRVLRSDATHVYCSIILKNR